MTRIAEKVKDIVDVRPWTHLADFAADPGGTLDGYHFTDITAELMAKWINRVADRRTNKGGAYALAGFRGVGKSHFLAVLATVISHPELRPRIGDAHVAASAERLSRKHGAVARVRRGSGDTLIEELRRSIAEVVGINPSSLNESLDEMLLKGMEKAGDMPFVVLVDTAFGRDARVARDDGPFLSELAEAARRMGIFVGVALDDDIAGADGANSSIAASFTIDYLDQEHLYTIVGAHIFSKHTQMLSVLQDLYNDYRAKLPGFRWSEQRFTSLYPLHPAILEIAPIIRLYVQNFALLGFASEAGVKILGRPADSLIGLDEVFDSVEAELRGVEDLAQAFETYDQLSENVVAKAPMQSRMQAKLVLKALLTLSLNGEGSTAAEISAVTTIPGESKEGVMGVDDLLASFAAAMPDIVQRDETADPTAKYSLKSSAKDEYAQLLAEAAKDVSDDDVWQVLLRQTAEKFPEGAEVLDHSLLSMEWRNAIRRGRIDWNSSASDNADSEYHIIVDRQVSGETLSPPMYSIVWRLSLPTSAEVETLKRFHLLQNDASVRAAFGDGLATAMHVHSVSVERIWQRVFLRDALLIDVDKEYGFGDTGQAAHNLPQMLSAALEPILDAQYPLHPEFPQRLDARRASMLISGFLVGSDQNSREMQKLAEDFALPLGLAVETADETFVPAPLDALLDLGIVKLMLGNDGQSAGVISLDELASRQLASPFGLTREAQRLVLGALVAQKRFEFVTSSGNRINHRSLDLHIVWEDIVGIARPQDEAFSNDRLILWARLITENSAIASMERDEDRQLIVDSLSSWVNDWRESHILARFDDLPDTNLNVTIWKTAVGLRRSFEAMVAAIESLVNDEMPLDKCLHTIADNFADSEQDYKKKNAELLTIRNWIAESTKYNRVERYLSLCPITDDAEVEAARQELFNIMETRERGAMFLELWETFRERYSEFYIVRHDAAIQVDNDLGDALRSPSWPVFESLASLPQIDRRYVAAANKLVRLGRCVACSADVAAELAERPHCACGFVPQDVATDTLAVSLSAVTDWSLKFFAESLTANARELTTALDELAPGQNNAELRKNVMKVLDDLAVTGLMPHLSAVEIRLIKMAATRLSTSGPQLSPSDFTPAFIDQLVDALSPAL